MRRARILACVASLVACDRLYADPVVFDSTRPTPTSTVGTPKTPPIACPNDEVRENSPCRQSGSTCEYGTSPDPQCNTTYSCSPDYGGYWTESVGPRDCTLTCPPSAEIVDGAPCDLSRFGDAGSDDSDELLCTTDHGTCACTTGPDAAHAHPRRWVCLLPSEEGCPAERPLLGHSCIGEHSCDYGACAFKRGVHMLCEDEVWQIAGITCE